MQNKINLLKGNNAEPEKPYSHRHIDKIKQDKKLK